MKLRHALPFAALSLVVVACGGSSDDSSNSTGNGGQPKGTPVALADLPGALASAYCNSIAGCCNAKMYPYDQAKCVAQMTGLYTAFLPSDPARADYDPQKGGDCVAAAAALSSCHSSDTTPTACQTMFVGKVAPGGTCDSGFECAASSSGTVDCEFGAGSQGACTVKPTGKAGDACGSTCTKSGNEEDCTTFGSGSGSGPKPGPAACYTNDGLYCDGSSYQCKTVSKLGGACTSTDGCEQGTFCDAQQCVKPLAQGAKCGFGALCQGGYCDDFGDKTCKPAKAIGAECSSNDECGAGAHCVSHGSGAKAKCEAADEIASPGICAGTGL